MMTGNRCHLRSCSSTQCHIGAAPVLSSMDKARGLRIIQLLFGMLLVSQSVDSTKFPNDVEGSPHIECNDGNMRIAINTTNGAASRIFAKGHFNNIGCAFEKTNSASFNIGACGMNRQRQLDPRGIMHGVVVIVQLHPLFVTKVDRAYNVKCFYMEGDKTLTSLLDVSMLSTQAITNGMPMPVCTYELHSETPNGPSARYARVGDKVWHSWSCPSPNYGMLVHSCFVTDGEGNEFRILDEKGCGVDQYVLRTPVYSSDLTKVQQETHVFKFADKTALVFNCQIKLCMKAGGGCAGVSPPKCAGANETLGNETFFNETALNVTSIEGGNATLIGPLTTVTPGANFTLNISEHGLIMGNLTVPLNFSRELNTTGEVIANRTIPFVNATFASTAGELEFGGTSEEITPSSIGLEIRTFEPVSLENETVATAELELGGTAAPNATAEEGLTNITGVSETISGHPSASSPGVFPGNITGNASFEVTTSPLEESETSHFGTSLGHNGGPSGTAKTRERNASDSLIDSATPRFLLLNGMDGRGRRNALRNIQERMREEETRDLLDAEARQNDAESIPIHHERHIGGGRLLLDDASNGDIETDVSQSMWVLEPEEGVAGDAGGLIIHPVARHQHPLDSLFTTIADDDDERTEDGSEIQQKQLQLSNGVCVSTKLLWGIMVPMILVMLGTFAAVVLCVYRKRKDSRSSTTWRLFPFMYMYKSQ